MRSGIIRLFVMVAISMFQYEAIGQSAPDMPTVGLPMPEFALTNVTRFKTKQVSMADFKGRWLFLNFWFSGCSTCITSLPKVNNLQRQFGGTIQFLLVALNNKMYGDTEELLDKLKRIQKLDLAIAYDSTLNEHWNIWSMPHIIVVGPDGIVKSITDGRDMDSVKISDLVSGGPARFYRKDMERLNFSAQSSANESLRANSTDIFYSAELTRWRGERRIFGDINNFVKWPSKDQMKGFQSIGVSLAELYKQAYLGQGSWSLTSYLHSIRVSTEYHIDYWDLSPDLYETIYPNVLLQVSDSSLFYHDTNNDTGFYNYILQLPVSKIQKGNLMFLLQRDLANAFGYSVSFEARDVAVWKLKATPGAEKRLKAKKGIPFRTPGSPAAGFTVRNKSVKEFLAILVSYLDRSIPYFNETGIEGNIDISIECDLSDLDQIKEQLNKHGLDLIKGTRRMNVMVISDPTG